MSGAKRQKPGEPTNRPKPENDMQFVKRGEKSWKLFEWQTTPPDAENWNGTAKAVLIREVAFDGIEAAQVEDRPVDGKAAAAGDYLDDGETLVIAESLTQEQIELLNEEEVIKSESNQ